ncbi:MAG: glycosyltransferase family 39 protein [Pyrinomonadaceae bacterium]
MPEITKPEEPTPPPLLKYVWILLAILTVFVYFFGLTIPFLGPDESRYAQVGREMFDRREWITPTLGGFNWFEKPALLYWLEIVSYKVFGINEFAARFGPALFGLGTVVSLWIMGRSLTAESAESYETDANSKMPLINSVSSVFSVAKQFANYLALIAASTLGIIVFSHGASFDIIITFPVTAALASFFIWHSKNEIPFDVGRPGGSRVSASLFSFYFFIGIALLAKGLIGIVFPFAIVGGFYLLSRRLPTRTFIVSLLWGTLFAAAIAAVWYLPMYQRHGYRFIDEFFIQHHFQRFTSNKYQHPQPFYFFLWVLPLLTLPWLPFFIAAMWKVCRRLFQLRDAEMLSKFKIFSISSSPLLPFVTTWLLVPLVFFSFSGSKLPGYILPAVPAAIIFTAIFVFELVQKSNRWRNTILLIATLTFIATIMLFIFSVPKFAESDSDKMLIEAANERGYSSNRVLTMHTVSHNAEFYASGRLIRDAEGKQQKLYSVNEILAALDSENGRPAVVLVPLEYLSQLTRDERITTEVLKDNGDLAVAVVSAR